MQEGIHLIYLTCVEQHFIKAHDDDVLRYYGWNKASLRMASPALKKQGSVYYGECFVHNTSLKGKLSNASLQSLRSIQRNCLCLASVFVVHHLCQLFFPLSSVHENSMYFLL